MMNLRESLLQFKGRRVLVTGNTGFKGAWLTAWLLKSGAKVAGFSDRVPFQPAMFELLGFEKRIEHHWGDVGDREAVLKVFSSFKPEIVFHLAAQPLVRLSYDEPVKTFQSNVMGTVHVLEAIRLTPSVVSTVMVTTDKVYSNQEWNFGYRETDRLGGHDPYSGSKAACELAIESYFKSYFAKAKPGFSLTVGRAGNVIGGGDYSLDRIIPDAVRAWSTKKPLVIRNPESIRPWQHVLEPLSGYLTLAANGMTSPEFLNGEAYNFAPRTEPVNSKLGQGTVGEITDYLKERWDGFQVHVEREVGTIKKETTLLRLSFEKARQQLGWGPRLSLEEAMEWTASWYEHFERKKADLESFSMEQISAYEQR